VQSKVIYWKLISSDEVHAQYSLTILVQVHNLLSEILKTEKLRKPKFFHGGRLQPKYDGHHDNDDDIDVSLLSRILKQGVMCLYCMYMYRCIA
jgi:hypothetical protein